MSEGCLLVKYIILNAIIWLYTQIFNAINHRAIVLFVQYLHERKFNGFPIQQKICLS